MPTMGQRLRHIIGDQFGAAIVEQTLEKALKEAKERAGEPTTTFYDPLSMFMGREWMQRRSSPLSFKDLRAMARNPIIGSIIQTRVNQVAAYCNPQTDIYDVGFRIVSDDEKGKKEQRTVKELQSWVMGAGIPGYGELSLESFARKYIRDSLVLDQACAEIVPRKNGLPAYMVAIDSATIRKLEASLKYYEPDSGEAKYVQVIEDQITASFTQDQMMFGVRNPQTDLEFAGYGMSELEMLMRVVTTILNTERYNSGQLMQGGTQKGLLVVKGDADQTQFKSFKRDFREAIRNASVSWRPPVLQVSKDADVDWLTLDRANRDMEYTQLFDFLVKQACGVYQIDPTEINWSITSSGASTVFQSGEGQKQELSQRRGLRPLLSFFASMITASAITKIDPRYRLEFVGMERDRAKDAEIREREVKTHRTVNEQRAELGLEPIRGGDVILNEFMSAKKEPTKAKEKTQKEEEGEDVDVEAEEEE